MFLFDIDVIITVMDRLVYFRLLYVRGFVCLLDIVQTLGNAKLSYF